MELVLASKSPRRRELMALITPTFAVDDANINESGVSAQGPRTLALELARQKAAAVAQRRGEDFIIGCDTVVDVDGVALGKPANAEQATDMLNWLSANHHMVHTGICVMVPEWEEPAILFAETTCIEFSAISHEEIERYVATDEPYDKAGGYGIQGWAAKYARRIDGCYYNVMGLPVASLYQKLRESAILPLL